MTYRSTIIYLIMSFSCFSMEQPEKETPKFYINTNQLSETKIEIMQHRKIMKSTFIDQLTYIVLEDLKQEVERIDTVFFDKELKK